MNQVLFIAVLSFSACGRTELINPGSGGAAGGQAGGGSGGGGGGQTTCAPSALCAATDPLAMGFLAKVGESWVGGGGAFGIAFDALDRPVIGSIIVEEDQQTHLEVRRLEAGRWQQLGCDLARDTDHHLIQMRMAIDQIGGIAVVWDGLTPGNRREIGVTLWDGTAWHQLPRPYLTGPGASGPIAIALIDGQPIVSWGLATTLSAPIRAFVARWDGTSWVSLGGALTGPPGQSIEVSSIAIDRDGQPVILVLVGFVLSTGSRLEVRRWNGSDWLTLPALPRPHQIVQSVADVQLDRQGRPLVAWTDLDPAMGPSPLFAQVARLENGGWVLLGENAGPATALALGPDDQPWLARIPVVGTDVLSSLSIDRWNGLGWDSILNGALRNQVASDVELAVNSIGQPGGLWGRGTVGSSDPIAVSVWQPVRAACP